MTRLALWYPYPKIGVAELEAPTATQTFWDFSAMDPVVKDFFHAAEDHSSVLSIATSPQWMFSGPQPRLPSDANTAVWTYEQGSELRDKSGGELADYYERVAQWYIAGGFHDELGAWHASGHYYRPAYWEVGNEPEYEHALSPANYTRIYDAVVARLHRLAPELKFTGMSLARPEAGEEFTRYFLTSANHAPGIPINAISYHFYALEKPDQTEAERALSFFRQADEFLETVRKLDSIRKELSPDTQTQINETGCIAASDQGQGEDKMAGKHIDPGYWSLCGAMFAYLSARLAEAGIEVVGASQLFGYPSQYPSVSLLDWKTGLPNSRYRSLQLLIRERQPGDHISVPLLNSPKLFAQAIRKRDGRHLLLLVNKTAADQRVRLDTAPRFYQSVDITTGNAEARRQYGGRTLVLHGYSVTIAAMR